MSDVKDQGGPAFPSHGSMGEVVHEGMTLRDYFAAHAPLPPEDMTLDEHASFRYRYADAMVEARKK